MAPLNLLPVERPQPTDFNIEISVAFSGEPKDTPSFPTVISRYIDTEISGKVTHNIDDSGNKLSKNERYPADSLAQGINKQNFDPDELNIPLTITDIEEITVTDDLSSVNNEQTAALDLSSLEQSHHFITLVNSANKILQTPQDKKSIDKIDRLATSQQPTIVAQEVEITAEIGEITTANKNPLSVLVNNELAVKISENTVVTSMANAHTANTTNTNTAEVTALIKALEPASIDASPISQSAKASIESSGATSQLLTTVSLKNTELNAGNQQAFLNQQLEAKVTLAENNVADSQLKHSLSTEQQHEQNFSMLNALEENTEVISTNKAFNKPNISLTQSSSQLTDISSQATSVKEILSSEMTIEEISHAVINDNISQVKNNAVVLNETISVFRKDFAEAVKDKIMVIISQKLQQFDIRLDPPELGSVHVRVNLQHEQAVVNFVVQNQQAKEAFEENLGKLKEMLSQKGIDVGDANVEQQTQQSSDEEKNSQSSDSGSRGEQNETDSAVTILSADLFKSSPSTIDYYA